MNLTVTPEEIQWLKNNYPGLQFQNTNPIIISGLFTFEAVYRKDGNKKHPEIKESYGVEIKFQPSPYSSLPQVKETNKRIPSGLHVNPDGTVCLCPSTDEKKRLPNGFNLKDFFNNLLIPYFYAQSYYERYHDWPWGEYSHGELGLLEHYLENRNGGTNIDLITELIETFKKTPFSDAYFTLMRKGKVKGHTACFCGSNSRIRDCHNLSFQGLWNLKNDIIRNRIKI